MQPAEETQFITGPLKQTTANVLSVKQPLMGIHTVNNAVVVLAAAGDFKDDWNISLSCR
ncbi:Hypothetical predicted protein [Podarcis lilfordi]|uniref:Uncharacterized protein n=1 Tax=Podarcis lilfordi TaxID=74358 RepID=A0AA35L1T0_9SAUR|nr:Hypothetical predicted protein [Podarcis lilfordi]